MVRTHLPYTTVSRLLIAVVFAQGHICYGYHGAQSCPAGTRVGPVGAPVECIGCSKGTYQSEANQLSCPVCASGKYSAALATSCTTNDPSNHTASNSTEKNDTTTTDTTTNNSTLDESTTSGSLRKSSYTILLTVTVPLFLAVTLRCMF
jgi:hypothetical protein